MEHTRGSGGGGGGGGGRRDFGDRDRGGFGGRRVSFDWLCVMSIFFTNCISATWCQDRIPRGG